MTIPLSIPLFFGLSIHIYGVMIALGLIALYYCVTHDKKTLQMISLDDLYSLISLSVFTGIVGGKILFLLELYFVDHKVYDFLSIYFLQGFSVLGTFFGTIISGVYFLHKKKINIFLFLDRIFIYIPLFFSIARLGCFFAGCCYGKETLGWYGVIYHSPESLAPLGVFLHPTQLYSSLIHFFLFIVFFWGLRNFHREGMIFSLYLISVGIERFFLDFLRDDSMMWIGVFSFSQIMALIMAVIGCILTSYIFIKRK